MNKYKSLIKKFSYNELIEECPKHGWRIPTIEEAKDVDTLHDSFWVTNTKEPLAGEGYEYVFSKNEPHKKFISNKNHLKNVVIVMEPCKWINDDEYYNTSCGNSFQFIEGTIEDNKFKHCPYCGLEIEGVS